MSVLRSLFLVLQADTLLKTAQSVSVETRHWGPFRKTLIFIVVGYLRVTGEGDDMNFWRGSSCMLQLYG